MRQIEKLNRQQSLPLGHSSTYALPTNAAPQLPQLPRRQHARGTPPRRLSEVSGVHAAVAATLVKSSRSLPAARARLMQFFESDSTRTEGDGSNRLVNRLHARLSCTPHPSPWPRPPSMRTDGTVSTIRCAARQNIPRVRGVRVHAETIFYHHTTRPSSIGTRVVVWAVGGSLASRCSSACCCCCSPATRAR